MKKKNLCTIAILLLLFVIFILIPVLHSISDKQLLNKTETGLYEEMSQLSSEQLIRKINHLEKNYQTMEEKTALYCID